MRSTEGLRCQAGDVSMLRASVREHGFACLEQAVDGPLLERLQVEARRQLDAALSAEGNEETPYRARIGKMGEVARGLLESDDTTALLAAVFGERLLLADDASCFTYYGAGDYLSLHRDRPESCLATLIVYLDAVSPNAADRDTGLVLQVYGKERPASGPPRLCIRTAVGTVVVGRGSETWHQRPPLLADEFVAALTACFFSAPSSAERVPDVPGCS